MFSGPGDLSFWQTVVGQSNLYQTWYGVQWFLWSPPDMVLVLILDSRKYGHHQIYLYIITFVPSPLHETNSHETGFIVKVSWQISYDIKYEILLLPPAPPSWAFQRRLLLDRLSSRLCTYTGAATGMASHSVLWH